MNRKIKSDSTQYMTITQSVSSKRQRDLIVQKKVRSQKRSIGVRQCIPQLNKKDKKPLVPFQ